MTSPPLKILLVEDDERERTAFSRSIENSQTVCEITACENAETALEKLSTDPSRFDIVITDYQLPGRSGLSLCKTLTDKNILLPFILLIEAGSEEIALDALKAGVDDYIIKDPDRKYLTLIPTILPMIIRKHDVRLIHRQTGQRIERLNTLNEKLLRQGSLSDKLQIITSGIVDIFNVLFTRIWITRPGDQCNTGCPHADPVLGHRFCKTRDRCLHFIVGTEGRRFSQIQNDEFRRVPFGSHYIIGRVADGREPKFLTNEIANHPRIRLDDQPWILDLRLVSFAAYRLLSDSGHPVGVLAVFSRHPISPEDDALLEGLSNTIAQVVQTVAAEEALRDSEEKIRTFLNVITDMAVLIDVDGNLLTANQTTAKKLGKHIDEIIDSNICDFPQSLLFTLWESDITDAIQTGKPVRMEHEHEDRIYDNHVYPIIDGQGKVFQLGVISSDITKRRDLEDQLLQAQKLEAVGTLAGGIAHDYNNLLAVVMGHIDLVQMKIEPQNEIYRHLLEATRACIRAKDLARQLITFSKGGAPVKKKVTIVEILKSSANLALSGSNVQYEFTLPENLWLVECDENQMIHVINNLVVNADHAMPDGGTLKVTAENVIINSKGEAPVLQLPDGKYVKISIEDHGMGIPSEHLAKIFEPYYTTKGMGTQKGMGLGLATVYSIINSHSGRIMVESEEGVGTTFIIYLPAHDEDDALFETEEGFTTEAPSEPTDKILLMDDEEMLRDLTSQLLIRLGYDIEVAQDGEEAIKLYKEALNTEKPFKAVILDLTVKGGMGGKAAIEALMKIDPRVKAIVSSGYSSDSVMTDYKKYGFMDVLVKPYNIKDLEAILSGLFGE